MIAARLGKKLEACSTAHSFLRREASRLVAIALVGSLMLSSCAVGPNFRRPLPPLVSRYTTEKLPAQTASAPTTGGKTQHFVSAQNIPAQWWEIFHSEPLNRLIQTAIRANPDLQAAEAALRVAAENTLAQRATFFPSVGANLNPTRHLTAHTLSSIVFSNAFLYTLNTAQVTVSYVPDVFGGNRRQLESLEAQTEAECFQREAVYLTLTSNVVLAVIQEAALRSQIKATRRIIAITAQQLRMMVEQREAGQIGAADVSAQEALLAQMQTMLPPLQKTLAQQHHLLAVLCGHFPSEEFALEFNLETLNLPSNLPLSLPSQLVQNRPDIRAAEAIMHATSAQIGVAIANRFPNIVLTADTGSAALNWVTLLGSHTKFWDIGANLAQPIFDAGMLLHQQRAAVAAYDQALAQYRSVVLSSFQDVADTLKAIQYDAENLKSANAAIKAAMKNLTIARQQRDAGAIGYLPILIAELAYQQTLLNLTQSQANRFVDTVALFQALGGGWWNRNKQSLPPGKLLVVNATK